MGIKITHCHNCGVDVTDGTGRAVAWFGSCADCARFAEAQMELLPDEDQPCNREQSTRLYRCRDCGRTRTGRLGWLIRCQVCLDDRTDGLTKRQRRAWERESATIVESVQAYYARPGWTVLATDVYGLPWEFVEHTSSHGTFGRHEACGTVAKLDHGRPECPSCPPEPDSRTYRARAAEPTLLYLVRYRSLQKYGIGTPARLRAHLAAGAEPLQVLVARHEDVVAAEQALRDRYRDDAIPRTARRDMPASFGTGTEVLPANLAVDLHEVLADGQELTADNTGFPG